MISERLIKKYRNDSQFHYKCQAMESFFVSIGSIGEFEDVVMVARELLDIHFKRTARHFLEVVDKTDGI